MKGYDKVLITTTAEQNADISLGRITLEFLMPQKSFLVSREKALEVLRTAVCDLIAEEMK